MQSGLTIFDENDVVRLDAQTLVGRVLGNFSTGAVNGSLTNQLLTSGTPFYFGFATTTVDQLVQCLPEITVSGTTISWIFRDFSTAGNSAPRVPLSVVYGIT